MIREQQWIMLDNYRRKLFVKYEIKKIVLTGIIKNSTLPFSYRYYALFNRTKIIRSSSLAQQRNRCVVTGRIWTVLQKTQYSRFVFRAQAYEGNIPGCRRASW